MSYRLGLVDPLTPTTAFAQAVDPYTWRFSPPGAIYSPYGWGPDMTVGMPMSYTHHINYVPSLGVTAIESAQWKDAMRSAQWKDAMRSAQWKDAMLGQTLAEQRYYRQISPRWLGPMYDRLSAMGNYVPMAYRLYSPDRFIPIPRSRAFQGLGAVELGLLAVL